MRTKNLVEEIISIVSVLFYEPWYTQQGMQVTLGEQVLSEKNSTKKYRPNYMKQSINSILKGEYEIQTK